MRRPLLLALVSPPHPPTHPRRRGFRGLALLLLELNE